MGVVELTDDGDILHLYDNPATERFFGLAPGSSAGRLARAELRVDDAVIDIWRSHYLRSQAQGAPVQFEYRYDDANQGWLWVTVGSIGSGTGGRTRFSYMAEDISERKQAQIRLRESEERFRATFENAAVGIAHVGLDGTWLRMNECVCRITGYSREELEKLTFTQITHPDDIDADWAQLRRLLAGEIPTYSMEKRYIRKGGSPVPIQLTVSLVRTPDGEPGYVISVIEDISVRKEAEEALREADRRKDEFLATLAHELRNPLAPISNAVQVMKIGGSDPRSLNWTRDVIERQLAHMVRLLDDLLDVNRISRGKIQLRRERVDLRTVLENAIETSRPLLDANRHHLLVDRPALPVMVDGDPVRLSQLFSNLLNNAARYTPSGGRIEVSVAVHPAQVEVGVRDNGIGIAPSMLPRIFDMFAQGDRTEDGTGAGLGIGLSLVKGLVEMHGGRVEASSAGPGRGSEFRVHLPIMEGAAQVEDEPSAAPLHAGSRRVLIIDDVRDGADSLALVLGAVGHEVEVAYGGEEGLAKSRTLRPDVILLDLGMPGMDGTQVCQRLREEASGREACIVALTGWGQGHDRQRTQAAGFDHHLVKPADLDALFDILSTSRRRARTPA